MGSVLIAMPNPKDSENIESILRRRGVLLTPEIVLTGSAVLRAANELDSGVVICGKNVKDMSCIELSEYLPANFGLIVLTADRSIELHSDRAIRLPIPLKSGELIGAIEVMTGDFSPRERRRKSTREINASLKKQTGPARSAADRERIELAKKVLMTKNGMTEPEAFRYMQKVSMDTGRKMLETAEMILYMNREDV